MNHAFYIPAFRIKKDVYPNQSRMVWFKSDQVGKYDIACAEYCGLNHSYMYNKINVLSENDFNEWLATGVSTDSLAVNDSTTQVMSN